MGLIKELSRPFIALAKAILSAIKTITKSVYGALKQLGTALWRLMTAIYRVVVVDFLWRAMFQPTGIIGANIFVVMLKGIYYGAFLEERIMRDGFFQTPHETYHSWLPLKRFQPPLVIQRLLGAFVGLVIGLRGLLDIGSVVAAGIWYGGFPEKIRIWNTFPLSDLSETRVFHSPLSRLLGTIIGFGIGLRCVFQMLILFPVAAWKGALNSSTSADPPAALFVDRSQPGPNDHLLAKLIGLTLGVILGWRRIINWIIYLAFYIPLVEVLFHFGLGAFDGAVPIPAFILPHIYIRPTKFIRNDEAKNVDKLKWYQRESYFFGAVTVGLLLGWTNLILLFMTVPEIIFRTVWYFFLGAWFGIAPISCHIRDGVFAVPGSRTDIYNTTMKRAIGGWFGASICGFLVGWRGILNLLFSVPKLAWRGPFEMNFATSFASPMSANIVTLTPQAEDLPPAYSEQPGPTETSLSSTSYPATLIGQIIAFLFGIVLGYRNWIRLFTFCLGWTAYGFKWIILGIWYGSSPVFFHCADGLFSEPSPDLFSTKGRLILARFGSMFGLIVGYRSISNFLSMIPRAAWYGPFFHPKIFSGSIITRPESKVCVSSTGRVFGGVFGLGMGWRAYTDILVFVVSLVAVSVFSFGTATIDQAGLAAKSFAHGLIYGIWNGSIVIDEGFINPLPVESESAQKHLQWAVSSGSLFGFVIGLRNLWNCLLILLYASWLGFNPKSLHNADGFFPAPKEYKSIATKWFSVPLSFGIGWRNVLNVLTTIPFCIWYGAFPHELHCDDGYLPNPGVSYEPPSYSVATLKDRETSLTSPTHLNRPDEAASSISISPVNAESHSPPVLSPSLPVYKSNMTRLLGGSIFGLIFGLRVIINTVTIIPKGLWFGALPVVLHAHEGKLKPPNPECWRSGPAQFIMGSIFGAIIGFRCMCNILTMVPYAIWYGSVGDWFLGKVRYGGYLGPPSAPLVTPFGRLIGGIFGLVIGLRNIVDFCVMCIMCAWTILFDLGRGAWFGMHPMYLYHSDATIFSAPESNPYMALHAAFSPARPESQDPGCPLSKRQYDRLEKVLYSVRISVTYAGAFLLGLTVGVHFFFSCGEAFIKAALFGVWNKYMEPFYVVFGAPTIKFKSRTSYIAGVLLGFFGVGWFVVPECILQQLKVIFVGMDGLKSGDKGGIARRAVASSIILSLALGCVYSFNHTHDLNTATLVLYYVGCGLGTLIFIEAGLFNLFKWNWWSEALSNIFEISITIIGSAIYLPLWFVLIFVKKLYASIKNIYVFCAVSDGDRARIKVKALKALLRLLGGFTSLVFALVFTNYASLVVVWRIGIMITSFILGFDIVAILARLTISVRASSGPQKKDLLQLIETMQARNGSVNRVTPYGMPYLPELITPARLTKLDQLLSKAIWQLKYGFVTDQLKY